MATIMPKHVGGYIVYIQIIYIPVNALVGHIYHNESSVHGHESFKNAVSCTVML